MQFLISYFYQKTITATSPSAPSGTTPTEVEVAHGISGIYRVIDIEAIGIGKCSPYYSMKLPRDKVEVDVSQAKYYISSAANLTNYNIYLTIRYTKS